MGKITSLKHLEALGLNTPELLMELPQFMPWPEKLVKWKSWATDRIAQNPTNIELPNISVRTTRDGEFKTPHYPNYPFREISTLVKWLSKDGYGIYLFGGIDPKDCKAKGNLHISKDSSGILELLPGPGTVRDLEKTVPKGYSVSTLGKDKVVYQGKPSPPIEVDLVVRDYMKLELYDQVLEWSVYNIPVGRLKQTQIYWELRAWQ